MSPEPQYKMTSDPLVIHIDDAIDRLGTGPFQHKILIAAGSCFMADAMEAMLLSFLALILEKEWNLSKEQTATIISLVFIGAMVGNLIFGPAGDRLGRRPIFFICSFIIGIFGIATSFVHGYMALILVRFVVGIGLGGLTVPFDILAEFLPTESRGKYLILIELFWTLGSLLTVLIAYCTIGLGTNWRWFVSLCAIPCFISMVLVNLFIPESPHWLVSQGRSDEALKILYRGALENRKDPMSLFPPGCILRTESMESSSSEEVHTYADPITNHKNEGKLRGFCAGCLSPLFTRVMLILSLVWFGSTFGYYGTIIAVARIFSNMDSENSQQASFDYGAFFISSFAEIVGAAIVWRMVEKLGRVPTIVIALSGAGLSLFLLCFTVKYGRMLQIVFAFSSRVFEMMISSAVWIITPELLSTEVRTSGHGIVSAIARIGGCLSPYVVTGEPLPVVGIVMLTVHLMTALVASRLPETKGVAMGRLIVAPLVHGPRTDEPIEEHRMN